jgi:hypothetical protein
MPVLVEQPPQHIETYVKEAEISEDNTCDVFYIPKQQEPINPHIDQYALPSPNYYVDQNALPPPLPPAVPPSQSAPITLILPRTREDVEDELELPKKNPVATYPHPEAMAVPAQANQARSVKKIVHTTRSRLLQN